MAHPEETPPNVDSRNQVQNGPTKIIPVWERAWTTDEMRKHCDRWSLAGDSALLHFLQEFSQKVISRTHDIQQLVDNLYEETKVTNSKVSNTINDFHMLSSTQFVESRVYDEDVQVEPQNLKKIEQKTKEQKEAEIVSKISQALDIGMLVMDQAFERVEIQQDSDSEDDSVLQAEVILEPKDLYIHRPLPYLIGSETFHKDDYVGLLEMLSEEEEKPEKESESEISTESESESDYEAPPKIIKEKVQSKIRKDSENESDTSDLFPEDRSEYRSRSETTSSMSEFDQNEDNDNVGNVSDATDGAQPRLLAEELDARLKQHISKNIKNKGSRRDSQSSVRSKSSNKSNKIKDEKIDIKKAPSDDDLFGTPEIGEEDDSLFGRKSGLFSARGKLFDDKNKEDELFNSAKENQKKDDENDNSAIIKSPAPRGRTFSGKKIPTGAVSIFGEDNDLFNAEVIPKKTNKKPDSEIAKDADLAKSTPAPKTKGLFDDSDEEDLFSSSRKSTVSSVKETTKVESKGKNTLFASDEEAGLFDSVEKKVPEAMEKKKPIGGVSLFGGLAGEVNAKIKAQRPPSDSDSDENSENLSQAGSRASSSSKSSLPTTKLQAGIKESRSNSFSSNSLFLEDPDADDIFSSSKTSSKQETISSAKDFLFDDDADDLFSAKPKKETRSSMDTKNVKSLFDSVEEGDIFKATSKPVVRKPSGSISLYPEDEITSGKNDSLEIKSDEIKKDDQTQAAKKTVSLFDDDGDDLFSFSASKRPTRTSSIADEVDKSFSKPVETKPLMQEEKSIKKNLFDDEKFLFVGEGNESPEVDLFTTNKEQPPSSTTAAEKGNLAEPSRENATVVPTVRKPVGGVALFGGVDLFGTRKNSKTVENASEDLMEEEGVKEEIKMPKRAPKLNETRELSLSFDDPVDTSNTLASACKDRARIQGRRRPPTRKNKNVAAKSSATEIQNPPPEPQLPNGPSITNEIANGCAPESKEEPQETFVAKDALDITSPSTEEEDLFSVDEPIKMHRETDLFAFHDSKTHSSRSREWDSKTRTDNIFSLPSSNKDNSTEGGTDVFSSELLTGKNPSVDMFGEDEDKGQIDVKNSNESMEDAENTKTERKNKLDLFNDDDTDDIFSTMPSKSTGSKSDRSTRVPSLFGDADDDDIFAPKAAPKTQPVAKRKENTSRKVHVLKQTNSAVDVFEDPLLSLQKEGKD